MTFVCILASLSFDISVGHVTLTKPPKAAVVDHTCRGELRSRFEVSSFIRINPNIVKMVHLS